MDPQFSMLLSQENSRQESSYVRHLFRFNSKPNKFEERVDFLKWDGEVCRDQELGTL